MKALAMDTLSDEALALAMDLRRLGIVLIADRPHLHYGPPRKVSPELRARIAKHCTELLDLIEGKAGR